MSNKPILFYSPNCQHSVSLWNNLKTNKILDLIIKINVNSTKNIPDYITSVPTLIVKGRPPLKGESIEIYLKSAPLGQSCNNSKASTQPSNNIQTNSESIQDFLPGEMGTNWSDSYSYIDSANPINHSYSF